MNNITRIIKDVCIGILIVGLPMIAMCIFVSDLVPIFAKIFTIVVVLAGYGYIFAGDIGRWVSRKSNRRAERR